MILAAAVAKGRSVTLRQREPAVYERRLDGLVGVVVWLLVPALLTVVFVYLVATI
jgi:hypothetical protein